MDESQARSSDWDGRAHSCEWQAESAHCRGHLNPGGAVSDGGPVPDVELWQRLRGARRYASALYS